MCILGAFGLSANAYLNYQQALDKKQQLETKISELAYTENVYNTFLAYNKYLDDLHVMEEAIQSPNDDLLNFIEELEEKMPAEITVLSASCTPEGIGMNITVLSKLAAAKTIQQLRSFESVGQIVVGEIKEEEAEAGFTMVRFSVECIYKVAQASTETEEGAAADTEVGEDQPQDADTADG